MADNRAFWMMVMCTFLNLSCYCPFNMFKIRILNAGPLQQKFHSPHQNKIHWVGRYGSPTYPDVRLEETSEPPPKMINDLTYQIRWVVSRGWVVVQSLKKYIWGWQNIFQSDDLWRHVREHKKPRDEWRWKGTGASAQRTGERRSLWPCGLLLHQWKMVLLLHGRSSIHWKVSANNK